ncbi:hypothetical protein D3C78_1436840 [compost metagenome]
MATQWPARWRRRSPWPRRFVRRRYRGWWIDLARGGFYRYRHCWAVGHCCCCCCARGCRRRTGHCFSSPRWPVACRACRRWCGHVGLRCIAAAPSCKPPTPWSRCWTKSASLSGHHCRWGCAWWHSPRPGRWRPCWRWPSASPHSSCNAARSRRCIPMKSITRARSSVAATFSC